MNRYNIKTFTEYITEASILDPKYTEGHMFLTSKTPPFAKELSSGDIITVVKNKPGKPDFGEGKFEKTFELPSGKQIKIASNNQSYAKANFKHLKDGKAKPSGEDWETLIIVAFNEQYDGPAWERAQPFWDGYGEAAQKIAADLKGVISSSALSHTGASRATLSPTWLGTNSTPKTDILGNANERISLKKHGKSQLMSARPAEAISTFNAAMKIVGKEYPKTVLPIISKIEEKMGQMTEKGTISSLEKLRDSGEELTPQQARAIAEMEHLQLNAKELTADLKPIFDDIAFKTAFCFEAATGTNKFVDEFAVANLLTVFNPKTGKISTSLPVKKVKDAVTLAAGNKFYVSFKTSAENPALALRSGQLSKRELTGLTESFRDIVVDELKQNSIGTDLLNEALEHELNEFTLFNRLISRVKDVSTAVANKAKEILANILTRIKKAFEVIKSLGEKMFFGLIHFLGLKIDNVKIASSRAVFPLV